MAWLKSHLVVAYSSSLWYRDMQSSSSTQLVQRSLARSCRSWTYKFFDVDHWARWTLMLEDGVWYFSTTDGIQDRVDQWWVETQFYTRHGVWDDLRRHRHYSKFIQWQYLTIKIMPYLNEVLESGEWLDGHKVKAWSKLGVTRRHGDVGIFVMGLVVNMALSLIRLCDMPACPSVERWGLKHRAELW